MILCDMYVFSCFFLGQAATEQIWQPYSIHSVEFVWEFTSADNVQAPDADAEPKEVRVWVFMDYMGSSQNTHHHTLSTVCRVETLGSR